MGQPAAVSEQKFFGHPRGLSTLFFTELWERFSYYGMRALLILFMTDTAHNGLGMTTERAGAIYGLYTFGVYALALPGGWIADRLVGQRRAVLYGGVLIALGHYALAIPSVTTFYTGLVLIVLGTGLLKPNVSAIVGDLYTETGARRDAGFSIFYMGINLGAFLGPLICSYLGEPREGATWVNWHYGFGAAGIGMTLALVQYVLGQKYLLGSLDAIPSQFCSGEMEATVVEAFEGEDPDVIIIEGQGALSHPAYLTSTFILRGSRPEGVVLQHAPGRKRLGDFSQLPMPTPAAEINLIQTFADTKVIGLTINHENMTDTEVSAAIALYECELGIPATDALTQPPEHLVEMVLAAFPELEEKLLAGAR